MWDFFSFVLTLLARALDFVAEIFGIRGRSYLGSLARKLRRHTMLGRLHEGHFHWGALMALGLVLGFVVHTLWDRISQLEPDVRYVKANITVTDDRLFSHWPLSPAPTKGLTRGMAVPGVSHLGGDNGATCLSFEIRGQPVLKEVGGQSISLRTSDNYKGLKLPCGCVQQDPPSPARIMGLQAIDPRALLAGPDPDMKRAAAPVGQYREAGKLANGWTELADERCNLAYVPPR